MDFTPTRIAGFGTLTLDSFYKLKRNQASKLLSPSTPQKFKKILTSKNTNLTHREKTELFSFLNIDTKDIKTSWGDPMKNLFFLMNYMHGSPVIDAHMWLAMAKDDGTKNALSEQGYTALKENIKIHPHSVEGNTREILALGYKGKTYYVETPSAADQFYLSSVPKSDKEKSNKELFYEILELPLDGFYTTAIHISKHSALQATTERMFHKIKTNPKYNKTKLILNLKNESVLADMDDRSNLALETIVRHSDLIFGNTNEWTHVILNRAKFTDKYSSKGKTKFELDLAQELYDQSRYLKANNESREDFSVTLMDQINRIYPAELKVITIGGEGGFLSYAPKERREIKNKDGPKEIPRIETHFRGEYVADEDIVSDYGANDSLLAYCIPEILDGRDPAKVMSTAALHASRTMKMEGMSFEEEEKQLKALATIDDLTGLYNKRFFNNYLETTLQNFEVQQQKTPFSMAIVDIDKFKDFNDTYGHDYGDKVLKIVADHLKKSFRSTDIVSRWGGEEFVILVNDNIKNLYHKLDWAREELSHLHETPEFKGKMPRKIEISGSTTTVYDESSAEEIFKRADKRLYQAKEDGRNRIYICEDNYQTNIGGPSCGGKTLISTAIEIAFKDISDYESMDRNYKEKKNLTRLKNGQFDFDDPQNLDWDIQFKRIEDRHNFVFLDEVRYDKEKAIRQVRRHKSHAPSLLSLIEGHWALRKYKPGSHVDMLEYSDLKIYIDINEEEQMKTRIKRDHWKDPKEEKEYIETNLYPKQKTYVVPTKKNADIIIKLPYFKTSKDLIAYKPLTEICEIIKKGIMKRTGRSDINYNLNNITDDIFKLKR